jgi:hypothetical protein
MTATLPKSLTSRLAKSALHSARDRGLGLSSGGVKKQPEQHSFAHRATDFSHHQKHSFANPEHEYDQTIDESLAGDHDGAATVIKTVTGLRSIEQRNHLAQNQCRDCRLGERGQLDLVLRDEEL